MSEDVLPEEKPDVNSLSDEEIDELYQELEAIIALSPLDYQPHAKQMAFHTDVHHIRAMLGGNRSGKTEGGCMEAWFHASGDYPEWYPQAHRFDGPTRGRIIVTDYKLGGSVLDEKIKKWWPSDRAKVKYFMGHIERIEVSHKTGGKSRIDVLTHEQGDMLFEGWSGHWAWFDEPPPREKYVATKRGLVDFGGFLWFTLTPISEPWLFDELMNRTDNLAWAITVSIYDNPHLTEANIAEYAASLTEEEKEARLFGKFRHLAGRVYKSLDESIHVVPESALPKNRNWPIYFVLDPADRRPHHAIWFTVDPFGVMYVFDELVYKGTIKETSKEIMRRERMMKINPMEVIRILDPNKGVTPSAVSGLRLVDEFASHAIYFLVNINDDLTLGHLAVSERLQWDKTQPISTTNHPRLYFIKDRTKETIKQMLSYVWDDWKGASKSSKSDKEKPKDINKDLPDCVRYGVVFNPTYFNPGDDSDPTDDRPEQKSDFF